MTTPGAHSVPVPRVESPDRIAVIRALREVMADAGFVQEQVATQLDLPSILALASKTREELLARSASGGVRDALIRLFMLAAPVEAARVDAALGAELAAGLRDSGVLRASPEGDRAAVSITPFHGLWIASDIAKSGDLRASDYVMGLGTSTQTLDTLTVRRVSGRVLDLGTGSGYHALRASAHADTVVGTDISARALDMARLNATLNGVANVEWRMGSFYEPVGTETFDLIVSNPPFVISPETAHVYRSAAMSGDGVTEHVVRGAAPRLAPGGIAQYLCNWAHLKGIDWHERIASWAAGSGCDLLVLRSETLDAGDYADYWVRHTREESSEPLADRSARWRASYEELGIEAASIGMILLRRRSSPVGTGFGTGGNWARFDDAPRKMLGGAGASVFRRIEVETRLAALRDDQLLDLSPRVCRAVRLDHTMSPAAHGWAMEQASARLVEGLAYETGIDEAGMNILMRSDGKCPLRPVVAGIATNLDRPLAEVAPAVLSVVRSMIRRGFLDLPAED